MAQIIQTGYQRAGRAARVSVQGVPLAHSTFDITLKVDDLETTNYNSTLSIAHSINGSTPSEGIAGVMTAEFNFGGDWDAHANPIDTNASVPGLYPRDDLANLRFFTNVLDSETPWLFTFARIRSAQNSAEVKGKVTFKAGGMNQGDFFIPVGSTT